MMPIDLHIHSHYSSDGEFDIDKIVEYCQENNIRFFSITDHNSTKGNRRGALLAQEKGLGFISGIEIDCNYNGTDMHLLGYGINAGSSDFYFLEEDVFLKTMIAFDSMIENLNMLGFCIDGETVVERANGKLPTGELIAEVML